MIDALVSPYQQRVLAPVARGLASLRVQPDQLTIGGFLLGILAVPALAFGQFGLALVLILLNRLADGLDGAIARATQTTDRGAFLDIALDFVFYALIPVGFALASPAQNALAATVLLAAFIGSGTSFLAFAIIAAKRGLRADAFPTKGIYYLGGLTEGAETIAFFIAICLWPGAFAPMAYVFSAACAVTTLSRWYIGWRVFSGELE